MSEVVSVFRRLGVALVAVGALALALSAASLYAIVSFGVTRRTKEIGLRVALGASTRAVLQSVLDRAARQLVAGAVVGLAGAVAVLQLVAQIPFDLPPADWRLTLAFAVVMFVAGLAACFVPARRALRIQPLDALRHE
jgi:putative ABC transport system permease protein